ncbi:MAG: putative rane protein [Actinomycetia bacterium]|nr:putative rane protein [Actinomycetes bacterium]
MSHLGQRISALIDGELSDSERDRVLAHIAGCDACRQEAVALRALKQRMHSLGEAMVDAALTGRLMAMAMSPDGRPWTARQPWRPRGGFPAARMLTAGILASTVAGLGAAAFFVGGEQQVPGPKVTPAVGTFLVQHAIVTGDLPVTQAIEPAGSSASAAAAAGTSSVPASPSSSRVTGTAAAGSQAHAARQPASHESRSTQSGARQSGSGRSVTGQAAGMMRRGLQQLVPMVSAPVPVATATVTASASPGP